MSEDSKMCTITLSKAALRGLMSAAGASSVFLYNQKENEGAVFADDVETMRAIAGNVTKALHEIADNNLRVIEEVAGPEMAASSIKKVMRVLESMGIGISPDSHNCDALSKHQYVKCGGKRQRKKRRRKVHRKGRHYSDLRLLYKTCGKEE